MSYLYVQIINQSMKRGTCVIGVRGPVSYRYHRKAVNIRGTKGRRRPAGSEVHRVRSHFGSWKAAACVDNDVPEQRANSKVVCVCLEASKTSLVGRLHNRCDAKLVNSFRRKEQCTMLDISSNPYLRPVHREASRLASTFSHPCYVRRTASRISAPSLRASSWYIVMFLRFISIHSTATRLSQAE